MKLYTFFLLMICTTVTVQAQSVTQKTGYADWQYIFSQMPEYQRVDNELKTHGTQLDNQLKAKYADYEQKVKDYQQNANTMVDAVRKDKEDELAQLQQSIQRFQQEAQSSIKQKQETLLQPIFATVSKAIEDVAKEHGYTFILNPEQLDGGFVLLYSDEKYDISKLVLKKMGITPKASAD